MKTTVAIVGAGPTGLMAACWLSAWRVPFVLIDKKDGPTKESRALAIQARTLEIFAAMGIDQRFVDRGQYASKIHLFIEGKERATVPVKGGLEDLTPYPGLLMVEQSVTESILSEELARLGGVVRWGVEVTAFAASSDGATLTLDGGETVEADYVIACDGGKSLIRHALNIPFEGGTYEGRFIVADVAVEGPIDHDALSMCLAGTQFAALFPMPGSDRFRLLTTAPWDKDDLSFEEIVTHAMRAVQMPIRMHDPRWHSVYHVHHRLAHRFRKGRVFLAGDAAHVHSPAGGQGMNTGLQDAANLGWKLGMVASGYAKESLLDTYEAERRPFAEALVQSTDRAFAVIAGRNPVLSRLRLLLAPMVARFFLGRASIRTWLLKTVSQIKIHYPDSGLNGSLGQFPKGAVQPGERPWPGRSVGSPTSFGELHFDRWTALIGPECAAANAFLGGLLWMRCVPGKDAGVWIYRPDGYLAYRSASGDCRELERFLASVGLVTQRWVTKRLK